MGYLGVSKEVQRPLDRHVGWNRSARCLVVEFLAPCWEEKNPESKDTEADEVRGYVVELSSLTHAEQLKASEALLNL